MVVVWLVGWLPTPTAGGRVCWLQTTASLRLDRKVLVQRPFVCRYRRLSLRAVQYSTLGYSTTVLQYPTCAGASGRRAKHTPRAILASLPLSENR